MTGAQADQPLELAQIAWIIATAMGFGCGFVLSRLESRARALKLGIAGVGLLSLFFAAFLLNRMIMDAGTEPALWRTPWIFSDGVKGQLSFGLEANWLRTTLSWVMLALTSVFAIFHLRRGNRSEDHAVFSALLLSAAPTLFALGTADLWLCMGAVLVSAVGSVVGVGHTWRQASEGDALARYLFVRFLGWVVFLCGTVALSAQGQQISEVTTSFSAWLIVLGVWSQTQAFPLSSSLITDSAAAVHRTFIAEILPAFVLLGLVLTLDQPLVAQTSTYGGGMIFVLSALLTTFVGLFRKDSRGASAYAFSALLCLAFLAGGVGEPAAALWIGLGAISYRMLLLLSPAIEERSRLAARLAVLFGLTLPSGIGFAGLQRLLGAIDNQATLLVFVLVAIFLVLLLAWRAAILGERTSTKPDVVFGWSLVSVVFVGSLALVWTGAWFGGGWLGEGERVFSSWTARMLSSIGAHAPSEGEHLPYAITLLGIQVLSFVIAYLVFERSGDRWLAIEARFPAFYRFVADGFRISAGMSYFVRALSSRLDLIERVARDRLPGKWVSRSAQRTAMAWARGVDRTERAWDEWLAYVAERSVVVPGRILQLVQSGDVQWYLVLALGSALAFLAYVMRNG